VVVLVDHGVDDAVLDGEHLRAQCVEREALVGVEIALVVGDSGDVCRSGHVGSVGVGCFDGASIGGVRCGRVARRLRGGREPASYLT
jgi:hypothetical protein